MYYIILSLIILLTISLALNTIALFRFVWQNDNSKNRRFAQNIVLFLFSLFSMLIVTELFFKVVFAQSDGFGYTLASKNWKNRYWSQNSLGYRDIEWSPEMIEGRTKIMVLGDSFVAGHGINDPTDRFSDLLGQKLGQTYAVMNVGKNGSNTKDEIKRAVEYPYEPDIIILAFYVNDIHNTATDMGFDRPKIKSGVSSFLEPLVEESYAFNFLYWRIYRLGPSEWENTYWNWLLEAYDNPDIWTVYQSELFQIRDYVKSKNGRLIVVVFPHLIAIEESRPITSKVTQIFTEQDVPVLDVTELVTGMTPADLVVNSIDSHPNEFVNRLVADKLYEIMQDQLTSNE